jgi:hypothetical protein
MRSLLPGLVAVLAGCSNAPFCDGSQVDLTGNVPVLCPDSDDAAVCGPEARFTTEGTIDDRFILVDGERARCREGDDGALLVVCPTLEGPAFCIPGPVRPEGVIDPPGDDEL